MYCTVNDIVADIGQYDLVQISNDNENATTVNQTLVEAKIADIGVYINSYISKVVNLPVSDASDLTLLKGICVSIVVCDLFQRRLKLDYSESLKERKDRAIKDLERIRDGKMFLNSAIHESETVRSSRVSQRVRQFNSETFENY